MNAFTHPTGCSGVERVRSSTGKAVLDVDETGFARKGVPPVEVPRQDTGTIGAIGNSQLGCCRLPPEARGGRDVMSVERAVAETEALRELAAFPLVEALFGRRSRRFALGDAIPDGPLAYRSRHQPVPLTEPQTDQMQQRPLRSPRRCPDAYGDCPPGAGFAGAVRPYRSLLTL